MPVTICRMRSVIDAEPKTYHQPIGPAARAGGDRMPIHHRHQSEVADPHARDSSQAAKDFSMFAHGNVLSSSGHQLGTVAGAMLSG